jgi:hypothetical protein
LLQPPLEMKVYSGLEKSQKLIQNEVIICFGSKIAILDTVS